MSPVVELDDVREALEVAAKVDFGSVGVGSLGEVVADVQGLEARLAGLEADVVSAYDASCGYAVDGHKSAAVAMRHRCRMHGGEAASTVRLARSLREMPGTAARLHDADITAAHARRLTRSATRPEFADAEDTLLEFARTLSFRDFDQAVGYWEQVVDDNRQPDGPDRPDPRETNRSLHVSKTLSGMGRLDGWLDPIGNAAFAEALRRIEVELFDADWALAKTEHGDAVTIDKLSRTPTQRRADALTEMAHRASTAPPDGKRPEPLVIVHVDAATFETALRRLADEPDIIWPTDRLCELDDGTVISPDQMLEQAITGRLRRLVYQSPGVILDFGRDQRLYTGALRLAIQARDRECDHPGCEIPARRCEIDHITPWEHGGLTNHTNGKARCSYHHRHHKPHPG